MSIHFRTIQILHLNESKKGCLGLRHTKALLIKFALVAVVLFSILAIFDTSSFTEILFISLLVTGASYVIGDLFILPRFGNLVASIADFGLFTASIWFLCLSFIGSGFPILIVSVSAAMSIALGEVLFHAYMKEKVLTKTENEPTRISFSPNRFQTEFSEENEIQDLKKQDKDN
ncbi:DUF2512 family protein [Priestia megaterium]|nr:DUF2512 family protein [Priestia megaterium]